MTPDDIVIRPAGPDDRGAIITLGALALGWETGSRQSRYLAWKHDENPFGPSLSWVATVRDEVVGVRTFMRWAFERDGRRLELARAVDTATHPEHQRRGIFRRLTLGALPQLAQAGIEAVFNTPNARSGAGYLTMGWSELGRPALGVVPRNPASLALMVRSRTASQRWSEPVEPGRPAPEALVTAAPPPPPRPGVWSTPRTPEFLRWRYALPDLQYRAVEVRGGTCVFRVRRRGPSREVVLCEWLSAEADPGAVRRLVRATGDYAVGIGLSLRAQGAIPMPSQGPVLTWRPLDGRPPPALGDLALGLGDLELF